MEAALVSASTGVMKSLLSKLTKLLEHEYVKVKGVGKKIRFLRDELSAMSATLQMLADVEQLNPEMRDWRDKLRELAYDLEDCVDAFMVRVDNERDVPSGFIKRFFRKLKKLKARHEIANQMEEHKARVIETSERRKRYNFFEATSISNTSVVDPRLPALYVKIDKLVGVDGPKKDITEWLTAETKGSSKELKVLSIVGCGGSGKTTLANQVYQSVKSQFSCSAFVSVSRNPDVKKILRDMAKGLGITDNTLDCDEQQLINKLREHLMNKRYLVVVDDVWDAKPWETIKLPLVNENCGSRIITTTRSIAVASCLSSESKNVYKMKPLSFDDSRRLLFQRAFGSENISFTHLGSVPDEILRKCDGLPLAIIAISSMLADQHAKCEWDRVLNDIGSALAKKPGAENMTTILSMSYFDIPHRQRTCLLYLSVFPEDYVIEKQCLITRWIAEGFIQEEEGQTKYEIGGGYFNDLVNRSMIQPVDVEYGEAEACRVHDIILDYLKCKAVEENFVTSLDSAEHAYTSEYKIRRLCLNNCNEEHVALWGSVVLSHVRSVTIFGQPLQTSLLRSAVLRLLDLGDCSDMSDLHLLSIEKLLHLKYLRVSSCSITELPGKIGELQYLQTLDVRYTRIKELPPGIAKLQRLAHLYVNWEVTFPDGMIGQMINLEELRAYGVQSYEQQKSLQEFSKLTKLRTLEIRCNLTIPDGFEGMNQILEIYIHLEALISSCNLHNLYIMNFPGGYPLLLDQRHPPTPCSLRKLCFKRWAIYKVPNWMGFLENLKVLELVIINVGPEDVEILGAIPSLLFLKLSTDRGTDGSIVIHPSNGFRCLKYFSICIYACGTSLEFEVGSMPMVEHVNLEFSVHKEECLNGASNLGIHHLSCLSKFEVTLSNNYISHDLVEDEDNCTARCVASVINTVETLPNCSVSFKQWWDEDECEHFLRSQGECNQRTGELLTEFLKNCQIDEEQMEQEAAGETEHSLTPYSPSTSSTSFPLLFCKQTKKEEDEQTSEKEVGKQEDNGPSN